MPPIPQIIVICMLVASFLHFLQAGARTFFTTVTDDVGPGWAQASFLVTGALGVIFVGLRIPIRPLNGVASAILLCCALSLYEWARHVIWGRRFSIAWSGRVPDSV